MPATNVQVTMEGKMKLLFGLLACASHLALCHGITEDLFYAMAQASCAGVDSKGESG